MSVGTPCVCGRKRGDTADLVVTALKCNHSAFNGYHKTPSDWSAVCCCRPNCYGRWRTKSSYVFDLPNFERDPDAVDALRLKLLEAAE